jgi:hypothetical protein
MGISAATALGAGCGQPSGTADQPEVAVEVEYVGNPNGVYYATCDPVGQEPSGRIVEIHAGQTIIDATNEYLPDGLKIIEPDSTTVSFADCHDYTVEAARTAPEEAAATVDTTLTAPETTLARPDTTTPIPETEPTTPKTTPATRFHQMIRRRLLT